MQNYPKLKRIIVKNCRSYKKYFASKNPSDKTLNAYFIPHIKGKDIKYELTNATFDK